MLRTIKILLVCCVALWGCLGALGNLTDWGGTMGGVSAAASMSTWEGGANSWRATDNAALIMLAAALIPTLKAASAVLCLLGAWAMWQNRAKGAEEFDRAKRHALAGCGLAITLLFLGWIVLAESWFELWRSEVMRDIALESAFRYIGSIGIIALFVAMPDDEAAEGG